MRTSDNTAESVEQSQEMIQQPHVASRADLTTIHKLAAQLIHELDDVPDGDMVGEIIDNALKLLRDQTNWLGHHHYYWDGLFPEQVKLAP